MAGTELIKGMQKKKLGFSGKTTALERSDAMNGSKSSWYLASQHFCCSAKAERHKRTLGRRGNKLIGGPDCFFVFSRLEAMSGPHPELFLLGQKQYRPRRASPVVPPDYFSAQGSLGGKTPIYDWDVFGNQHYRWSI